MTNLAETPSDRLYTRRFFQAFAAVLFFMTGVALQFHFGQYIEYLGYGVDTLGRILGISMVGALLIRMHVGRWIDRFGCRPAWLVGTIVVALAVGTIQFVEQLGLIIVLRSLTVMATATVMTSLAVFAAQIAPPHRRAESLGTIGLGGFLGMIIGPTLGDWIFAANTESILPYRIFFSASAMCSLLAGGVMMFVAAPSGAGDDGGAQSLTAEGPTVTKTSQLRVVLAHWPGAVLIIGVSFSMVFCIQSMFLERLAEERGFGDIKVFFLVYCPTAMILRILCRRVPERIGRSRVLLGGLLLLGIGLLSLIGIQSQWDLVLPGMLMGAGHCFIFPSMVDLAAERLPVQHRGTGTALILGAGDLGMLIGFLALGELIEEYGFDVGLICLAVIIILSAGVFAICRRDAVLPRGRRSAPVGG